jgi:hypothetical protein
MKLFVSLFALILFPSLVMARDGQEGGGGSQIELDFVQVARFTSSGITQSMGNESLFDGFNLAAFNQAIGLVEIHEVDTLCRNEVDPRTGDLRKRCLDAFYDPSVNQIQLNAESWRTKSCVEKMAIAVHEFGRASGNENGSYQYSSRVALSKFIPAQCIPYQNQAGVEPLSCAGKASYLEQALHSMDAYDMSTLQANVGYTKALGDIVASWNTGLGKGCSEEGKAACIRVCFLKAGSSCFGLCNGN